MLSVEEGSSADACPKGPCQDAPLADFHVADQRVERRPGLRVARAVLRRRDLDHDAGIGRTIRPVVEVDTQADDRFCVGSYTEPLSTGAAPRGGVLDSVK